MNPKLLLKKRHKGLAKPIMKRKNNLLWISLSLFLMLSALHADAQQVSINKKNATLEDVLEELRKQTGYDFAYTSAQVKKTKPLSIQMNNKSLREILDICCLDQPITYTIENNTIIIKDRRQGNTVIKVEQQAMISGRVLDSKGKPLAGATIRNISNGVERASDQYGVFIMPYEPQAVVRFTMVGYLPADVRLKTRENLEVRLEEQNTLLDELVVVGYGTTKKENLTTAVSTITSEQITQMPTTNISQVFAGRLPGLLSRSSSGTPGADNATLLVRTSGIGQQPLLVIDGVPRVGNGGDQVGLQEIDPNEVESISVLKDNAAGAVYGARAANGVIIITTKRGKIGKPKFSYTNNTTWSRPGKMIENLDGYHYALGQNEIALGNGNPVVYNDLVLDTIKNQLAPYKYANTDWIKMLTGTSALVQAHNLNISGGNEAVRYFVSGSYTDQNGMYAGNGYERYTLQNNFDFKLSNQFKAEINVGYRGGKQDVRGSAVLNTAANASPLTPVHMPDGTFGVGSGGGANPMAMISERAGYLYNKDNYMTMTGRLTWQSAHIKGLSAYSNISVEKSFSRSKDYAVPVPLYQLDPTSPTGTRLVSGGGKPSIEDKVREANTYTADFGVNYKRRFGKHQLDAMGIYTMTESRFDANSDRRLNMLAPGLDIINLGSTLGEVTSGNRGQSARMGYVGRLSYNYEERLFLESSFRFDGSTIFAPGHRWGFFPGVSAGWNIAKEHFFSSLKGVVSSLKLRASVGLTGDDGIGANTYYYTYRVANAGSLNSFGYIFGGVYSPTFYLANGSLPNYEITWAKNRQENIGVDAMLWNGKLGLTVDVFQKNRYDMLLTREVSLPGTFGINAPIQNFGKLRDRGIDLNLSSHHKLSADWSLGMYANLTYVKTVQIDYGTKDLPDYQRREGRSTNTLVGYKSLGIFQNQAEIDAWQIDQDGLGNKSLKPGDLKYADLKVDGVLNAEDQYWVDNYGFPPLNAGLGFDVNYKKIMLTAFFNGAFGGYIQYNLPPTWDYTYENSWRPGNEDAKYPRMAYSTNNTRPSDARLIKDDFVRLRDLRLAYTLPDGILKTLRVSQVRIYGQASNLFTWTSVEGGIDPETPNTGSGGNSGGFYPTQKNIGFGLNVTF